MTKPKDHGDGLGNGDEIEEMDWIIKVRSWRWIR